MIRTLNRSHFDSAKEIYYRAAMESDVIGYTAEQRSAWAAYSHQDAFSKFVFEHEAIGWFEDDKLAGFCSYRKDGYIKGLYVSPEKQRRGIGKNLLAHALSCMDSRAVSVVASKFSLGLFESHGFELVSTEASVHNGVAFERYIMELRN